MKRVLIFSAAAAAAIAAAVPAVAGLAGNPSFSHKLPVHVPSQAQVVGFDDHGHAVSTGAASTHASTPSRSPEPGDDNGGARTSRAPEPGDDNGGARTSRAPEPGDDNGGTRTSRAPEPGDDSGGHGSGSGRGH
jgi:hypothetical protein